MVKSEKKYLMHVTHTALDMTTLHEADTRGRSPSSCSGSSKASVRGETADADPASGTGCGKVLVQLWRDFLQCYSTPGLLRWSMWWALATAGYNQILNYVQVLWEHTEPSSNFTVYNGGVEAASSLFGEPLRVVI